MTGTRLERDPATERPAPREARHWRGPPTKRFVSGESRPRRDPWAERPATGRTRQRRDPRAERPASRETRQQRDPAAERPGTKETHHRQKETLPTWPRKTRRSKATGSYGWSSIARRWAWEGHETRPGPTNSRHGQTSCPNVRSGLLQKCSLLLGRSQPLRLLPSTKRGTINGRHGQRPCPKVGAGLLQRCSLLLGSLPLGLLGDMARDTVERWGPPATLQPAARPQTASRPPIKHETRYNYWKTWPDTLIGLQRCSLLLGRSLPLGLLPGMKRGTFNGRRGQRPCQKGRIGPRATLQPAAGSQPASGPPAQHETRDS